MLIETTNFGPLDVAERELLRFAQGLPGFPGETLFALVPHRENSPFVFLQSAATPGLVFTLVESFAFFGDYEFEIGDELACGLGLSADNPPQVFSIVTIPENAAEMTANLLAPVVVNFRDRAAMQIVLDNRKYTTRHRLFPQGWPSRKGTGRDE